MLPFVWQLPSTGVLLQLHRKMEHFLLRFPKYLWFVSLANLYKSLAFVVLSSLPFFSVEGMAASFCIITILMIGMLWAFPSGHGCYWDGGREGGREDNTTTGKLTIVWNVHPWTWGDPILPRRQGILLGLQWPSQAKLCKTCLQSFLDFVSCSY